MAKKRKLGSHVIEVVEVEEEVQPTSDSSDGEDEDVEENDEEYVDDEDDEEESEGDEDEGNNQVEDAEDFSSKESIVKLLQPFPKSQLIEIFKEAALKSTSLYRIIDEAETTERNIFIFGLGPDVTRTILYDAFSPFGKIVHCKLFTRSRKNCGFVLFRYPAAAHRALKEPEKKIGKRIASCRLAYSNNAPNETGPQDFSEPSGRKIYVSNVGNNIEPESLLAFFSKFGEIENGPLGYNKTKGKFNGYAIFFYKTVEGCAKALEEPTKYFQGCVLQCRRAHKTSTEDNNAPTKPMVATKASNIAHASATSLRGQNLTPGPTIPLSAGAGLHNSAFGVFPAFSGHVNGFPPLNHAAGSVLSGNRGFGIGVNSISPSIMDNYSSVAALHGLGAYKSAPDATIRRRSGTGFTGASGFPPF